MRRLTIRIPQTGDDESRRRNRGSGAALLIIGAILGATLAAGPPKPVPAPTPAPLPPPEPQRVEPPPTQTTVTTPPAPEPQPLPAPAPRQVVTPPAKPRPPRVVKSTPPPATAPIVTTESIASPIPKPLPPVKLEIEPKEIHFGAIFSRSKKITVHNPGPRAVRISDVYLLPKSVFNIKTDCRDKVLEVDARCEVNVSVRLFHRNAAASVIVQYDGGQQTAGVSESVEQ